MKPNQLLFDYVKSINHFKALILVSYWFITTVLLSMFIRVFQIKDKNAAGIFNDSTIQYWSKESYNWLESLNEEKSSGQGSSINGS